MSEIKLKPPFRYEDDHLAVYDANNLVVCNIDLYWDELSDDGHRIGDKIATALNTAAADRGVEEKSMSEPNNTNGRYSGAFARLTERAETAEAEVRRLQAVVLGFGEAAVEFVDAMPDALQEQVAPAIAELKRVMATARDCVNARNAEPTTAPETVSTKSTN